MKIVLGVIIALATASIAFFIYRIVAAENTIYRLFGYWNH